MESRLVELVYRVPAGGTAWELSGETMPESVVHDQAVELLRALLAWWARGRSDVQIARNLAIRWDEAHPQVGVDPDVCVLSPAPPDGADLRSVRTWQPGHTAPRLAVEVVSETNPHKDYLVAPEKYAASGTGELWIFDPLLSGPKDHGGPFRIQVWQRDEADRLVRTHAGDGPAPSRYLGAYLVVVKDGVALRITDDANATSFWLTGEEAERAAKEAERAAKEAALAQVAALEAALARLGK
jgi:Uma2 family endonuclease